MIGSELSDGVRSYKAALDELEVGRLMDRMVDFSENDLGILANKGKEFTFLCCFSSKEGFMTIYSQTLIPGR